MIKNQPYSLSFHRFSFSILENVFDIAIRISTGNNEITRAVEMLVFHSSIISHFHRPSVFSINGYVANIFRFGKSVTQKNILFIGRLIWVLFIEGLKYLRWITVGVRGDSMQLNLSSDSDFLHFSPQNCWSQSFSSSCQSIWIVPFLWFSTFSERSETKPAYVQSDYLLY